MTGKQSNAINVLSMAIAKYRGVSPTIVTAEDNGKVSCLVSLQLNETEQSNWLVSIGKNGGYGLPNVLSYTENGQPETFVYGQTTSALGACVWGDRFEADKGKRKPRKPVAAAIPPVPVPVDPIAAEVARLAKVEQDKQEMIAKLASMGITVNLPVVAPETTVEQPEESNPAESTTMAEETVMEPVTEPIAETHETEQSAEVAA